MRQWPIWWKWELEFTPHLLKRMIDRQFTEVDLREMLENATGFKPDIVDGRWIIETRKSRQKWEEIVEPEEAAHSILVITACRAEGNRR
ncbi:MAG TPA: hypothetical protein VKX17_10655 [Planctomycetota bacterium]|nr:hypothetical protein [Planctomycetota bacterium]